MAYNFSVNNNPSTGGIAMYQLVTALLAAGWLKKMDSDGTTYSSTGVQVTHGGTGAGGLGNTSAWVRMQSPQTNGGTVVNQTREMTFQRSTVDTQWRMKYSASALFTGGSPGITQTPSATDELFMNGAGTDASPTYQTFFGSNATYVWHVMCGGAAEFYSFVCISSTFGQIGATTNVCLALDVMQTGSYPSSDVDPAVVYCSNSSSITDLPAGAFPTANVTNPCKARAWLGATSAAAGQTTGTNNQNVNISGYGTQMGVFGFNTHVNPWTNKDDLFPCLWGGEGASSPKGVKGFSTLFMSPSIVRINGETCDTVTPGSKDKIYFNGLWLPWSGAVPIV